jgi:hypothetical protein
LAESITGRPKSAGKDLTMGLNRRQTKEVGRKTSGDGMTYQKKLIEVALPLDAINKACVNEDSPFTPRHPRSLHGWWARRPLAAARAVIFLQMVDDPSGYTETLQNGPNDFTLWRG